MYCSMCCVYAPESLALLITPARLAALGVQFIAPRPGELDKRADVSQVPRAPSWPRLNLRCIEDLAVCFILGIECTSLCFYSPSCASGNGNRLAIVTSDTFRVRRSAFPHNMYLVW